MSDEGATKDPGGQQPEFLKGLGAATQSAGQKPVDQSERATPATTPEPASPAKGQERAADMLKDDAEKDTGAGS